MSFPYLTDVLHAVGINIPLPVPTFGLLVGAAFFTGKWLAEVESRRVLPAAPPDFMGNACIVAFLAGLFGARLFHLLEYPREFLEHPAAMLFSRSGFTIFGGLIVAAQAFGGFHPERLGRTGGGVNGKTFGHRGLRLGTGRAKSEAD